MVDKRVVKRFEILKGIVALKGPTPDFEMLTSWDFKCLPPPSEGKKIPLLPGRRQHPKRLPQAK